MFNKKSLKKIKLKYFYIYIFMRKLYKKDERITIEYNIEVKIELCHI